ncbi:MAG: Mth938-like domain-containing protein [Desulfohalobiaceae bacterium]|nr:Mth938-like domain-containing protein [Desulfohalobiaceae bacterium]
MEIQEFQFGRITIQGQVYTKDLKICGEHVLCPWWRKKGHQVDVEDIQDLIDASPEQIILGRGSPGLMQATERLKQTLQSAGIPLLETDTPGAVVEYNRLAAEGRDVGLGLHLFC